MPVRDLRSMSAWMKIALCCLTLGLLLFIVGFATDSWMVSSDRYRRHYSYRVHGLWKQKYCDYNRPCRSTKYNRLLPDFHRATQGLECVALIGMGLGLLLLILYNFVDQCRRRQTVLVAAVFLFGAVLLSVIGYIVFAVKYEEEELLTVGWSMGVAIAGTILAFVAFVMCVLHLSGR